MRTTYRYKNKHVTVADNEDVYFEVRVETNLINVQTAVNIPGDNDFDISNSDRVYLGKGKDLRASQTIIFSAVSDFNAHDDEIKINYYVNDFDTPLVAHSNPVAEEERPLIVITIHFDAP